MNGPVQSRAFPPSKNAMQGVSLLEITIVAAMIAWLASICIEYYLEYIEDARQQVIETSYTRFASSINMLHAHWYVDATRGYQKFHRPYSVALGQHNIYFNEEGWPSNTDQAMDPGSHNQTALECLQLWQAVLKNPPPAVLVGPDKTAPYDYLVSSVDELKTCRYQLRNPGGRRYYFDYHPASGTVSLNLSS